MHFDIKMCLVFTDFQICCLRFNLRTGCYMLGTFRILIWILCIILACYYHLNEDIQNQTEPFSDLMNIAGIPIGMFFFDSIMLVKLDSKFSFPFSMLISFPDNNIFRPNLAPFNLGFCEYSSSPTANRPLYDRRIVWQFWHLSEACIMHFIVHPKCLFHFDSFVLLPPADSNTNINFKFPIRES